jgi:hypothetical protein
MTKGQGLGCNFILIKEEILSRTVRNPLFLYLAVV